jgi:hypothetical protein
MKFSSAVDALSRENKILKQLALLQAAGTLGLIIAVLIFHEKQAVQVERTTHGLEIVSHTNLTRTKDDVEHAIGLMLKARLDTSAVSPEVFISARQMELRITEQRELKSRGLDQEILPRSVQVGDGQATAEIDRVLRVGEIRSALKTKVTLAFEEIEPNELNPYGLRLANLTPIDLGPDGKTTATSPMGLPSAQIHQQGERGK